MGPIERVVAFQQAFWKFLRPHTIRGTILGSIAVTARALIESPVVGPPVNIPNSTTLDRIILCNDPGTMHGTLPDRSSHLSMSGYSVCFQQHTQHFLPVGVMSAKDIAVWCARDCRPICASAV